MNTRTAWVLSTASMSLATLGVSLRSHSALESPAPTADEYSQPATRDWPLVGGDWSNTRYSSLAQVDTSNVRQLGVAWVSDKFREGGTSKATPVIKNGVMFVTAGHYVYALNARTGESIWSFDTIHKARTDKSGQPLDQPSRSTHPHRSVPNGKGVGAGEGLVYVGLRDGNVIALSQQSGELAWIRQTGIDQPKTLQWAAVAPTYSNGYVFTGLSNGDANLRGRLTALDARTGKQLWQVFSIPGPGEPGHETWPDFNDTWKFGGGGVWTNSPVDPELGLVYFATGNPVPAFAGDWRPGDNLYTCSVLAVDIKTGKLKWHYQLVHHDVFEGDVGTPVILYEAQVGGKSRRGLAVLRADGYLFQLDRETGKPLLPVHERPVPRLASQRTSPTQPFPVSGESFLMSCDDWRRDGIPAGFALGCMWTPPASPPPSKDPPNVLAPFPSVRSDPMAYSPQTGYFYAQGTSLLTWPRRSQDPYFLNFVGNVPGLKSYEELAAIDSRTGKLAWRERMSASSLGGAPIATAGGLIFRTSADGSVRAHSARTGESLWDFQTGMSGGSGPAASYEVDGEQYVAVSMGAAVWAFKLGGRTSTATVATIPTAQDEFSGPIVDTHEIETTSLHRTVLDPGKRYFVDEYTFSPYRARVQPGTTITFANNGNIRHEVMALDGSWGTGPLSPTQEAWVTFDTPGQYTYICKDHPWSYGQIVVDATLSDREPGRADRAQSKPSSFAEQVSRGREQFGRHCSVCHADNLSGRLRSRRGSSTVGDLFDNMRATMPQVSPGSLSRQTYLDIIAFLLDANRLGSRKNEIEDNPERLKAMQLNATE